MKENVREKPINNDAAEYKRLTGVDISGYKGVTSDKGEAFSAPKNKSVKSTPDTIDVEESGKKYSGTFAEENEKSYIYYDKSNNSDIYKHKINGRVSIWPHVDVKPSSDEFKSKKEYKDKYSYFNDGNKKDAKNDTEYVVPDNNEQNKDLQIDGDHSNDYVMTKRYNGKIIDKNEIGNLYEKSKDAKRVRDLLNYNEKISPKHMTGSERRAQREQENLAKQQYGEHSSSKEILGHESVPEYLDRKTLLNNFLNSYAKENGMSADDMYNKLVSDETAKAEFNKKFSEYEKSQKEKVVRKPTVSSTPKPAEHMPSDMDTVNGAKKLPTAEEARTELIHHYSKQMGITQEDVENRIMNDKEFARKFNEELGSYKTTKETPYQYSNRASGIVSGDRFRNEHPQSVEKFLKDHSGEAVDMEDPAFQNYILNKEKEDADRKSGDLGGGWKDTGASASASAPAPAAKKLSKWMLSLAAKNGTQVPSQQSGENTSSKYVPYSEPKDADAPINAYNKVASANGLSKFDSERAKDAPVVEKNEKKADQNITTGETGSIYEDVGDLGVKGTDNKKYVVFDRDYYDSLKTPDEKTAYIDECVKSLNDKVSDGKIERKDARNDEYKLKRLKKEMAFGEKDYEDFKNKFDKYNRPMYMNTRDEVMEYYPDSYDAIVRDYESNHFAKDDDDTFVEFANDWIANNGDYAKDTDKDDWKTFDDVKEGILNGKIDKPIDAKPVSHDRLVGMYRDIASGKADDREKNEFYEGMYHSVYNQAYRSKIKELRSSSDSFAHKVDVAKDYALNAVSMIPDAMNEAIEMGSKYPVMYISNNAISKARNGMGTADSRRDDNVRQANISRATKAARDAGVSLDNDELAQFATYIRKKHNDSNGKNGKVNNDYISYQEFRDFIDNNPNALNGLDIRISPDDVVRLYKTGNKVDFGDASLADFRDDEADISNKVNTSRKVAIDAWRKYGNIDDMVKNITFEGKPVSKETMYKELADEVGSLRGKALFNLKDDYLRSAIDNLSKEKNNPYMNRISGFTPEMAADVLKAREGYGEYPQPIGFGKIANALHCTVNDAKKMYIAALDYISEKSPMGKILIDSGAFNGTHEDTSEYEDEDRPYKNIMNLVR